jgi:hypothetical protein
MEHTCKSAKFTILQKTKLQEEMIKGLNSFFRKKRRLDKKAIKSEDKKPKLEFDNTIFQIITHEGAVVSCKREQKSNINEVISILEERMAKLEFELIKNKYDVLFELLDISNYTDLLETIVEPLENNYNKIQQKLKKLYEFKSNILNKIKIKKDELLLKKNLLKEQLKNAPKEDKPEILKQYIENEKHLFDYNTFLDNDVYLFLETDVVDDIDDDYLSLLLENSESGVYQEDYIKEKKKKKNKDKDENKDKKEDKGNNDNNFNIASIKNNKEKGNEEKGNEEEDNEEGNEEEGNEEEDNEEGNEEEDIEGDDEEYDEGNEEKIEVTRVNLNTSPYKKMLEMNSNVLKFFGNSKEGKELSNFYKGIVMVDGRKYNCGESAFHGSKYIVVSNMEGQSSERKKMLLDYGRKFEIGGEYGDLNGATIKSKGGKKGLMLNDDELEYWNIMSDDIQIKICEYKYENDSKVKEVLDNSRGRFLLHPGLRMSLERVKKRKWEGRIIEENGSRVIYGGNRLGYIWMNIRDG